MKRIKNTYLAALAVLLSPLAANGDVIDSSLEGTISNDPDGTPTGSHIHSTSTAQVGTDAFNDGVETPRGIAEFDLSAAPTNQVASLLFTALAPSGLGSPSAYDGVIEIIAYFADLSLTLSDYEASQFDYIGSFTTTGIMVGDVFSFDVTNAYNTSLGGALGFRLQIPSIPPGQNDHQWTFDNFQIRTKNVPEPGTLALLGLGLAGIGFARRKKV